MEVVVYIFLDKIAYKLIDANSRERKRIAVAILGRCHSQRAQFDFSLAFKDRLNNSHRNGCYESVPNILIFVTLAEIFLDGAGYMLLECTLVGTALGGMLSVDIRIVFFSILLCMGECNVNAITSKVNNGIQGRRSEIVSE